MRKPASTPSAAEFSAVRIARIGAEGDGIGRLPDGKPVFVPFTLPGELVRAHPVARRGEGWAAQLDAVLEPAAERVSPLCPHFGTCGGCTLQHWHADAYLTWKSGLLRDALHRAGYADAAVASIRATGPHERRRMDLAAQRTRDGVTIGLHARGGPVVELHECHVLHPALFALRLPLRPLLRRLQGLRREASVVANLCDNGADLLLRTDAALTADDRSSLIAFAQEQRLARLSWAQADSLPEPVLILRPPEVTLSGVAVQLPPGGFLQASAAGAAAIVESVLAGLPSRRNKRTRVVELYAGCGTLSFALAQHVRVTAFEGDAAAAEALRRAANAAGLAGRIDVKQRDLARQPLSSVELAGFDAVVLDPPHAGAALQTAQIAAAKPSRVIYVSCNPAALARDARTLHQVGYRLLSATPIDQFLWSARLESVCTFSR